MTTDAVNRASLPMNARPCVLVPWDVREALSVSEAATIIGCSLVTVRSWAALHDIGRRVGGRWMISRVALAMHLDSDRRALMAYLAGDRESEFVIGYFKRFGIVPIAASASAHGG